MSRHRQLVQEFEQRLLRLKSVTGFTRQVALFFAAEALSGDDLERHLRHTLPVVERFIEPFQHSEFRRLCDEFYFCEDYESLAREFQLSSHFEPQAWFVSHHRWYTKRDIARSLVALANHLALPMTDVHREPMMFAPCISNLAELNGRMFDPHNGVGLYEFVLQLSRNDYGDPETIQAALHRFAPVRLLFCSTLTNFLEELLGTMRLTDAETVVSAVLQVDAGLRPSADQVFAGVRRILEKDQPPFPANPGSPINPKDMLRSSELLALVSVMHIVRRQYPDRLAVASAFTPAEADRW